MNLLAVNFHYFREQSYNTGIYPVTKSALIRQIDALSKYYKFISQDEICLLLSGKNKVGNYCIITMDDGLKEQMAAYELLMEIGIPSILYVPSFPIEFKKVLDVHKLHYIRTEIADQEIFEFLDQEYAIDGYPFDYGALANQYRYDDLTSQKVKYYLNFVLNRKQKNIVIDTLFKKLVSDEETFAKNLYINELDIQKLVQTNSLGSHSANHLPLSTLEKKDAKNEVVNSINFLENIGGCKIVSFSYPYGGPDAVDESLLEIFMETHIEFAFTMRRGINTEDNFKNPLFLNRVDTNDAPGGKNRSVEYCLK